MMKKCSVRKLLPMAMPPLAIFVLPLLAANWLLRHLGDILSILLPAEENAKFDFPLIFGQLREARIAPHIWLPLACAAAFGFLLFWLSQGDKKKPAASVAACAAFVACLGSAFLSALLLTTVNGIRFGDLLAKLIPLIDKL